MMKFLSRVAAAVVLMLAIASPASAQFNDQMTWGGTSTGTANSQTILVPNYTNTPGVVLRFIPGFTNTGAVVLTVNSQSVPLLRPSSIGLTALSGAELTAGELTCVTFNGTIYQLSCNVDMTRIGQVVEIHAPAGGNPRGTLVEDGSCVSRTTYAPLFAVLGTTYGVCDGSTTFAVPDSRGTVIAAYDNQGVNGSASRITTATCGTPNSPGNCGSQTVTLSTAQMPAHTHTGSGNTSNETVLHTHDGNGTTGTESAAHSHTGSGTTGLESNDHTHTYTSPTQFVYPSGANGPIAGNIFYNAGTGVSGGQSANHNHVYNFTTATESAAHTHVYGFTTTTESIAHIHVYNFTTSSTGSGSAAPILPPVSMALRAIKY